MSSHQEFTCGDDLLSEEFENLLRRLDHDRERAGEKYEDIRRKLSRFFSWNNCFPEEDFADMTLDRAATKLANGQVDDVSKFIWGVAKNIKRECYRHTKSINIEDLPPGKRPQTDHPEQMIIARAEEERQLACLQRCVQDLADSDRELFVEYEHYAGRAKHVEELAARLTLSISALRTRAHRIRRRVELCTLKCLQGLKNTS